MLRLQRLPQAASLGSDQHFVSFLQGYGRQLENCLFVRVRLHLSPAGVRLGWAIGHVESPGFDPARLPKPHNTCRRRFKRLASGGCETPVHHGESPEPRTHNPQLSTLNLQPSTPVNSRKIPEWNPEEMLFALHCTHAPLPPFRPSCPPHLLSLLSLPPLFRREGRGGHLPDRNLGSIQAAHTFTRLPSRAAACSGGRSFSMAGPQTKPSAASP